MIKILFLDDSLAQKGKFLRLGRKSLQACGERLHQAVVSEGHDIERFSSEKKLFGAVRSAKPQLVFAHEFAPGLVNRILAKYPFVSIIVYGEFIREKKLDKLVKAGVGGYLKPPFDRENVMSVVEKVMWSSVSKRELWDDQMDIVLSENRQKHLGNALTCLVSAGILLGVILGARDRITMGHGLPYERIYTVPYTNPTGISLYGSAVWICDWKTQNIYKHSSGNDFSIKGVYSFPEKRFSDIAFGGGYLWACDPWEKKIFKYKISPRMELAGSYESPGPNPQGIDFDGKYLWICDNATDKIYQLSIDDRLSISRTFDAPGSNPVGIFCDAGCIWTCDSGESRIYRHRFDDRLSVDSEFLVPDYMQISGMDGDDNNLWICSEKGIKVYRYPKKLLEPVM